MPAYFFDSSGLVKCYAKKHGLRAYIAPRSLCSAFRVKPTLMELSSALAVK